MKLKTIKKLNLKDGDMLLFPKEKITEAELDGIAKLTNELFSEKRIIIALLQQEAIDGLKIVNVKNVKKSEFNWK